MRCLLVILAAILGTPLAAQAVTVGTYTPGPLGAATLSTTQAQSYVNLTDVATRAGTVNKASVHWSTACSNAFKVVFLRSGYQSASSFTVVATRGPFNAVAGRNVVELVPPVTLAAGDVIGVVQLLPSGTCGTVGVEAFRAPVGFLLITTGDISTTGTLGTASNYSGNNLISAMAYDADPVLVRVVPVVGSVIGANESFFRTSLQMTNPEGTGSIAGKLVFHPAGQPASASDPSLAYSIGPRQTVSYPDVIAALGASGIGSLDVFSDGGTPPVVAARVFDDQGSAGTSGLSEEAVPLTAALDFFSQSLIPIPADLANYRINVGVRTLTTTTLTVRTYNAAGTLVKSRENIVYAANEFRQGTAAELAGFGAGETLPPGGSIRVAVTSFPGEAIVYSSVIDNRTNDSTYRLANPTVR
jgi:hypothetical protein